ncbi:hypothetical protein H0N98_02855 [Candidatus Micrarchaeota archaeon]|nr:hypothetical protein [Candidatus Micrarchaeota archaeon]
MSSIKDIFKTREERDADKKTSGGKEGSKDVFGDIIRERNERNAVMDIVTKLGLFDRSKELKPKEMADGMLPVLKEKNIKPSSPILHEELDNARKNLERIDAERAKKVTELQEELKKRSLA